MSEQDDSERQNTPSSEKTPPPSARMGTLAREYPELASFTADATLLEIKTIYGLASLEDVRRLGLRRVETGGQAADRHAPTRGGLATRKSLAADTAPSAGR